MLINRYFLKITSLVIVALWFSSGVYASTIKQDVNLSLEFGYNEELSEKLMWHYFSPKHEIVAYNQQGQIVNLSITDTILVKIVEHGYYGEHNGDWLVQTNFEQREASLYIPFTNDLKDVSNEKRASNAILKNIEDKQKEDDARRRLYVFLLLALPFISILLYAVYCNRQKTIL
jgi:hypothetical protein